MDRSGIDKPEEKKKLVTEPSQTPDSEFTSYPKLDSIDLGLPPPPPTATSSNQDNSSLEPPQPEAESLKTKSQSKSVTWSSDLTSEAPYSQSATPATTMPTESNPYVSSPAQSSSSSFNVKDTVSTVKDVLGRWGKKMGETSKKGQDLAGNVWQHLKTGPSFADAAMGRIAQGTKVLAEGGYEKIFQQTFETIPEEKLQRTYACYLSTSAGPVMGILYISTAKLAFCSDNPLPYKVGGKDEWSYYKVVIPLHQLKAVNTSISKVNRAEKYIQVVSVDNHEFWFMGFVNYDSAVKYLQDALEVHNLESG